MTTHVDHLEVSLSVAKFSLSLAARRPFPPAAPEASPLDPLTPGERRALAVVYGAFLTGDDPYLEAYELAHLAAGLDLNEDRFQRDLAGLGVVGLLGVTRSRQDFEVELVEGTTAGMAAFCRAFLADRYETLLCEVARRVVQGVADGPSLRQALPWEPGLLLTHIVETLSADGWLEVNGHFGGSCGWQIARVSPELRAWVTAERAATVPSVWTMRVAEPMALESVAA